MLLTRLVVGVGQIPCLFYGNYSKLCRNLVASVAWHFNDVDCVMDQLEKNRFILSKIVVDLIFSLQSFAYKSYHICQFFKLRLHVKIVKHKLFLKFWSYRPHNLVLGSFFHTYLLPSLKFETLRFNIVNLVKWTWIMYTAK